MDFFILYSKLKNLKKKIDKTSISIKTYFTLDNNLLTEEIPGEILSIRKLAAQDLLRILEIFQKYYNEKFPQEIAKEIVEFINPNNISRWKDKLEELSKFKNQLEESIVRILIISRDSIENYITTLLEHMALMVNYLIEKNIQWIIHGKSMVEHLSKILKYEDKNINDEILNSSKLLFMETKKYTNGEKDSHLSLFLKIGSFLDNISLFVESLKDERLTEIIQDKMRRCLLSIKKQLDKFNPPSSESDHEESESFDTENYVSEHIVETMTVKKETQSLGELPVTNIPITAINNENGNGNTEKKMITNNKVSFKINENNLKLDDDGNNDKNKTDRILCPNDVPDQYLLHSTGNRSNINGSNNKTKFISVDNHEKPVERRSRLEKLKRDFQSKGATKEPEKRMSFNKLVSGSDELKLKNKIVEMKKKEEENVKNKQLSPPPTYPRRLSLSVYHMDKLVQKKKAAMKVRCNSEPSLYSYVHKKAPELDGNTQDKLMKKMQRRFSMKVLDELVKKNEGNNSLLSDTASAIDNLNLIANLSKDDINYKLENGKIIITSASIAGLLSYLVGMGLNVVDTIFMKDFLTTYRYFLTPPNFLSELISIWNREIQTSENNSLEKWQVPIRLRTVNVIKQWALQHPYDFEDKELLSNLSSFIDKWDDKNFKNWKNSILEALNTTSVKPSKNLKTIIVISMIKAPEAQLIQKKNKFVMEADSLITWLIKHLNLSNRNEAVQIASKIAKKGFFGDKKKFKDKKVLMEISDKFLPIQIFEKPLYTVSTTDHKFNFLAIPAEEIARQLTLIDQDLFDKIDPQSVREWVKDSKRPEAKKVNDYITRFNIVSQWVASKIILTTNLKKRRLILKKFLAIAAFLRQFTNYHALMSFICAFNFGSVTRLSETWKGLTKAEQTFVDDLKELASTQNNCRNIRVAITIAETPSIPYIALFLKDVFFIEEGNKDYTPEKKINWEKMTMVGNVFRNFQKFQHSPKKYLFAPIPFIQKHLLDGMNPFTENELYRFSKLAEPKSGEDINIEAKVKKIRKNKEKEINLKRGTLREDVEKNRESMMTSRKVNMNVPSIPESIGELQKVRKIEQTISDWSIGGDGSNLYKKNPVNKKKIPKKKESKK
eukprot:TRINITY_DN13818_c0_g1_i1.p1 TRINITY_DN13818_c0_g1~~TRINITY_DN13818_c0_g1_i1.p1  ORF type:complete len:1118 (-),score=361.07 TRINITY_DN13818_c0_g1_i1:122-3475(-)